MKEEGEHENLEGRQMTGEKMKAEGGRMGWKRGHVYIVHVILVQMVQVPSVID